VLSKLLENHKAIRCKWVFQTKKNAQGKIVHHKTSWLVVKRCTKKDRIDFSNTFVLVIKFILIRVLLANTTLV